MAGQAQEKNQSVGFGKYVVLLLCIVIILLVALVVFMFTKKNGEEETTTKRETIVTAENVDEVLSEVLDTQEEPAQIPASYDVMMNSTWNFPDGTSASTNAYVENYKTNTTDVYFDLELADTGEVIYESPILPVGSKLDDITLKQNLEKGEYDCIAVYHLVNENQETLSEVNVGVKVIIEN